MKRMILIPILIMSMVLIVFAIAYVPPSSDNVILTLEPRTSGQSSDNIILILDYQSLTNSCTYTTGNFRVNLSDGCNITTNVAVSGGGFETYGGPGYVNIYGNITGVDHITLTSIGGTCSPTTCFVRCVGVNGVCIRK